MVSEIKWTGGFILQGYCINPKYCNCMNINGDCKDELPEDGSIFNWPFNPKNDDITKMWAYAYCPADDIDCPPLTVK